LAERKDTENAPLTTRYLLWNHQQSWHKGSCGCIHQETYLAGGDHDTNLLDGLGEFIGLNGTVVVKIEVLERLKEYGLLVGGTVGFLGQLVLQFFLEARQ